MSATSIKCSAKIGNTFLTMAGWGLETDLGTMTGTGTLVLSSESVVTTVCTFTAAFCYITQAAV